VNSIIEMAGSSGNSSDLNSRGVCSCSRLDRDSDGPDSFCDSHSLQCEFWNSTLKKATTAFLQILFAAALINHSNIERHVV
jgi:hypothetical protein